MQLSDKRLTVHLGIVATLALSILGCDSATQLVCPSVGAEGMKPDIVNHVNQLRATEQTCGDTVMPPAPPLAWDDILGQAALGHSADMAANEFVGHDGTDGSTVASRLTAQGYAYSTFGENLLAGVNSSREAADRWLGSPEHCENLMNPAFTELGVAAARGPQGECDVLYWTMVLARPAGG